MEETYHFTSKRCPHSGESEETSEALEENAVKNALITLKRLINIYYLRL